MEKSRSTAGGKERTHSEQEQVSFNPTNNSRQSQPDAAAATTVQILGFLDETVENKISHSIVQDVGGQDKTHLRDVTATKEQTVQSTLPTAATKTRLRMRRKTVEVPQMHDIDKMVRRCCAERG